MLESQHEDNPQLFNHETREWTQFGTEYLKTLDSLTGYLYQRLRLGQWVAAEGMFFPEFSPDEHYVEPFEIPKDWPRWVGVDYGFAVPFCALWLARDPDSREIYVYREAYGAGLRDEQQADLIKERSKGERILQIVADPSHVQREDRDASAEHCAGVRRPRAGRHDAAGHLARSEQPQAGVGHRAPCAGP